MVFISFPRRKYLATEISVQQNFKGLISAVKLICKLLSQPSHFNRINLAPTIACMLIPSFYSYGVW